MQTSYPLRQQWLGNIRGDLLSGMVVALALIPEAIAFSLIAGVDPKVGLYAAFSIAVVTAIAGGRPGMISAATGAMALVMVDLVKDHGLQYLFAASILAGLLQVLVAIVVLTAVVIGFGVDVRSVGDMGQLPDSLPHFLIPDVPLTWETLRILLPVSATLAVVGLLESMMTLQIVEDITETPSERNRECVGQGVANTVTGFLGGMAGCAMIGQSVINVTSGGRGRLSCLVAGALLLVLVVYGSDLVRQIPMAALVAVMIMVSIGTFSWRSLRDLRTHPRSSSAVMLLTVVVTVATHDLAKGVLSGVLLSALFFARKVGRMLDVQREDAGDTQVYRVRGQVFFASAGQLGAAFDYQHVASKVQIDLRDAHLWDLTAVAALERAQEKLAAHGAQVTVVGLNAASQTLIEQVGGARGGH